MARGLAAGADEYISKPFDPVELLSRLRAHAELPRDRPQPLVEAREATALRSALGSNRANGVAIGVLIARHAVISEQEFDMLRKRSTVTHRKLSDTAEAVVLTGVMAADP